MESLCLFCLIYDVCVCLLFVDLFCLSVGDDARVGVYLQANRSSVVVQLAAECQWKCYVPQPFCIPRLVSSLDRDSLQH